MIRGPVRLPYLTDNRVQTFYFFMKRGASGEVFSLQDLSDIPNGYQLSTIYSYLPRWKEFGLKRYILPDGRLFYDEKRPDRQFYLCRPLSLWVDWDPFMRSCFRDRRPILPPRLDSDPTPDPWPVPTPAITAFLEERSALWLVLVLSCLLFTNFCASVGKEMRKQWRIS